MLRIFVTGDNHIGLKYVNHEKSALLAKTRIDAFVDMVRTANEEECELFVITGDLFENTHSLTKREIKELFDILSTFSGAVAILPGNHDYYDIETKLYRYIGDYLPMYDNILLMSEYRPYTIELDGKTAVLYPALCTSQHSEGGENNLGKIASCDIIPDSSFRIGVAHGSLEGLTIDNEGEYFPMTQGELESIPVDAWLIGHTHVPYPILPDGEYVEAGRIFNPGTHTQTDLANNTEGLCFILEIEDGDGQKRVLAKKVRTGKIRFARRSVSVSHTGLKESLESALSDLPDSSVVDIILTGAADREEYDSREGIIEASLSRFIEARYNDVKLTKLISRELIDSEFPETSFAARLLYALINEPKEAQLAYDLLKSLGENEK